ncbi:hypothetical protein J5N97_018960 [Dioscorea zingiberensis]|uniref:Uncharacterized protein n=1 Tax=Dioscorea zingiberensis TaxID=325984 RepID=A0A9D5CD04_9LILI|nr:hypothetical protein J5N97_018960 [Dioscorea zingiberensis]
MESCPLPEILQSSCFFSGDDHKNSKIINLNHELRWGFDIVPNARLSSAGSSPGISSVADAEEFVKVILDFHPDDTIVLRSVELAQAQVQSEFSISGSSTSTVGQSPSNRIRQFSQDLKAEALRLSHDFMVELKKLSRSQGHESTSSTGAGFDTALAARALRRQRTELDRSRSGTQKALHGLRFISTRTNGGDGGLDEG